MMEKWGKTEEEEEEPRGRSSSSLEKRFSLCDGKEEKKVLIKYFLQRNCNLWTIYAPGDISMKSSDN